MELLGRMPRHIALGGRYSKDYFTRKGELKNIKSLKYWQLKDVLQEKYNFDAKEAVEISEFLLPMLEFNPIVRQTYE